MRTLIAVLFWVCLPGVNIDISDAFAQESSGIEFEVEELPTELTVGYAVRPVDVNGDGKLDIAIVDSKRVLWLENPDWTEHVVYETPDAQHDNVTFAPADINANGRVDFALGADWQFNNTDSGGTIGWLEHTEQGLWRYHELATEPTTHRMNWLIDEDRKWLIVGPLKGRGTRSPGFDQTGIRLLAFQPPENPAEDDWKQRVLTDQLHVMHNFTVTDLDEDGQLDLVTASYEGVTWVKNLNQDPVALQRLGTGQEQEPPQRGASEIRRGKLRDGRNYLATIEPWHGDKVVVYLAPEDWPKNDELWQRFVLDDQLAWGHAVSCSDLDGDGDQELIVGVRDDRESYRRGLRIYDPIEAADGQWQRYLVDPGGVAIEDLTVADFDGDGDDDVVAVGRATQNVRIYWNQRQ